MHCVANGSEEEKERKKEKKKNDDEKLLGSFSFIKLQVLCVRDNIFFVFRVLHDLRS